MPQPSSSFRPSAITRLQRSWRWLHNKPGGRWLFSRILGFAVPYSGSLKAQVVELEPGHARVKLVDRRSVRNHLNSIHAIALANLGEMASGLSLLMSLPDHARGIVTSLNVEYLKKARGIVVAEGHCSVPELSQDMDITAYAEIKDQEGELLAKVTANWRVGLMVDV